MRWPRWLLGLGFAALALAYVQHARVHGGYQVDDAGITFAYARNLAEGHGLVTNPGDPTFNEGYSNPAWTVLLAAFMVLGAFDLIYTPKILSAGFTVLTFAVLAWIVRRFDDERWGPAVLVPGLLLTANGSFVLWSIGGLENPQYVAAITLAVALYLRDTDQPSAWPRSGPVFFLAAVSRPEGLIYTVMVGTEALVRAWRTGAWRWLLRLTAGVAAPLSVYVAWHLWTYGDLLPNTYYAKSREVSVVVRLLDPRAIGWRYLIEGMGTWVQGPLLLVALVSTTDREAWRRGLGAVWLALAGSVIFTLQSGGDWMMQYRFLSPTFALLATLAAVGLTTLGRLYAPRARPAVAMVGGVALAGLVASALSDQLAQMKAKPTVPLADRLTRLPRLLDVSEGLGIEQPVILMSDMGGPMWVNDRRQAVLLDMFGLCTREVALALHHRDVGALWDFGFRQHAPDLMQFPPTMYDRWRLDAAVVFQDGYMPLDDHRQADAHTGYFLRRARVEPPWDDAFALGEVVVQRPVRIHRVAVVPAGPGAAEVTVDFSLMRPASAPPRARIVLQGEGVGDVSVDLLPALRPAAFMPDRVYRHTGTVAVPEGIGVPTSAAALGTPEPSTLPAPRPWRDVPLVGAGAPAALDAAWTLADPTHARLTEGALVYAVDDGDNRLCLPAALWSDELRLEGALSLRSVQGSLDLDVRWFDPQGAFLGRSRAWRWERPFAEGRQLELALDVPDEAYQVRACLVFVDGGGEVAIDQLAWRVR